MLNKTLTHAEQEFEILSKSSKDPDNRPVIEPFKKEILALVEAFGNSGQSGGSAPYTATAIAQAVKALCLQDPIMPIMGTDDEWRGGKELRQNKRCSAVFKGKKGVATFIDAIIWRTQNDVSWNGIAYSNGKKYSSEQKIKKFPFIPKTFTIDVVESKVNGKDWEFQVKDPGELKEVFEYYDELKAE